jgi:hypothetical protein
VKGLVKGCRSVRRGSLRDGIERESFVRGTVERGEIEGWVGMSNGRNSDEIVPFHLINEIENNFVNCFV